MMTQQAAFFALGGMKKVRTPFFQQGGACVPANFDSFDNFNLSPVSRIIFFRFTMNVEKSKSLLLTSPDMQE